jgi:ribosomal-protein-alanine N-acetyltransferase
MRIETSRLVIRAFEPRDAGAWIAMVNDPEVNRFLPPEPVATMETFQQVLERRHAMEREIGYAMWAADDKATGAFVGQCGIRPLEEGAGPEVELGYHYTRASWGKGYGTEAVIAVLAHGLGPVGLDRIMAVAMPENTGSWRVMEKAGMRYEGLASYYGLEGMKKYAADRQWWRPPRRPPLTGRG